MPDPIALEERSAIDKIAEGSISDQLEPEPVAEPEKKDEPKVEYVSKSDFEKLQNELLEARQEQQFLRGYLSKRDEKKPEAPAAPVKPTFDYEQIRQDIEARGPQALEDFVDKIVAHRLEVAKRDVETNVDGKLGQRDVAQRQNALLQNEINQCVEAAGELWGTDDFKNDADKEAAKILSIRLGRAPNFPEDVKYYQPGDLYSAVMRVMSRRGEAGGGARNGNGNNGSSLREITRRVPKSDDLGNGNGNGNRTKASPKTIDDIDMPQKEKEAAKRVFRKLQELNPGMTEQSWIESYNAGAREAADNA